MRNFGTLAHDAHTRTPVRRTRRRHELGFVLTAVAVLLFVGMMLGAAGATFIAERNSQTQTNQKA